MSPPTQAMAFQFSALLLSKFWYSSWSTITAQLMARSCTWWPGSGGKARGGRRR
jgi:hypothetical protein